MKNVPDPVTVAEPFVTVIVPVLDAAHVYVIPQGPLLWLVIVIDPGPASNILTATIVIAAKVANAIHLDDLIVVPFQCW